MSAPLEGDCDSGCANHATAQAVRMSAPLEGDCDSEFSMASQ